MPLVLAKGFRSIRYSVEKILEQTEELSKSDDTAKYLKGGWER